MVLGYRYLHEPLCIAVSGSSKISNIQNLFKKARLTFLIFNKQNNKLKASPDPLFDRFFTFQQTNLPTIKTNNVNVTQQKQIYALATKFLIIESFSNHQSCYAVRTADGLPLTLPSLGSRLVDLKIPRANRDTQTIRCQRQSYNFVNLSTRLRTSLLALFRSIARSEDSLVFIRSLELAN